MKALLELDGVPWEALVNELGHKADFDFYGTSFTLASTAASSLAYLKRVYHYFLAPEAVSQAHRLLLLEAGTEPCRRLLETLRPKATVGGHLLIHEGFRWGLVLGSEALLRYYASKFLRLAVVEHLRDEILTLHAASLEVEGCGVLLIGEAASGKTSTTLRLLERGGRYAADDTSCIRRRDRICVPFPMPLMVRAQLGTARPGADELVGREPDIQVVDEPRWLIERWDAVAQEFHPSHLLFFDVEGVDSGQVVELTPAQAALGLLRNIVLPLGASPDEVDPEGRDFDLAVDLVEGTACFAVGTRDLERAYHNVLELLRSNGGNNGAERQLH